MDRVNNQLTDIHHQKETPISRHMQTHSIVSEYPFRINILQLINAKPRSQKAELSIPSVNRVFLVNT